MRRRTTGGRVWIIGLAALLFYAVVSLIYFWPPSGHLGRKYFGDGGDPGVYIWCLNWWPWALTHAHNPFVSDYVWSPYGFNMTWANSVASAALIMSPITWLTNSAVSFNVLTLAAPVLSGWIMFLLVRYLTKDTAAALISGYLFGFSSYELAALRGHLSLDLTFVVPLCVWLVVLRFRSDLSRWQFIAGLAPALLVQLGLSIEILATTCFFGGLAWAVFLVFAEPDARRQLFKIAAEIILAGLTMCGLAALFLFYVLKDVSGVPQINSPEAFSADLLNYLVPTAVTNFGRDAFNVVTNQFTGNLSEQGSYLGLPLIIILVVFCVQARRRRYFQALFITLVTIVICSLGPKLNVAGVNTGIWLPWSLAGHLPLIHQALPTRFCMYVALLAGLAAGFWLASTKNFRNRILRFTLAALACLAIMPNRSLFRWNPLPLVPFFDSHHVMAALGRDPNIIVLPYGGGASTFWQWQSKMSFTQSGGYVSFTPPSECLNPAVASLYANKPSSNFERDLSAFCGSHHVSAIVVGPGTSEALVSAVEGLHWRETDEFGVRVLYVPNSSTLSSYTYKLPYYTVSGDYWPDTWMGRRVVIQGKGQPMELEVSAPGIGPLEITVDNESGKLTYQIAPTETRTIKMRGDEVTTLTANTTFVPDKIVHNGDRRVLSAMIRLVPIPSLNGTDN